MTSRRKASPQTRAVLTALHGHPAEWRHGYDIAQQTGLASGTLYPILGRLSDAGLVETHWEEDPPTVRPRRHLYRLTADGIVAAVAAAEAAPAAGRSAGAAGKARKAGTAGGAGTKRVGPTGPAAGGAA